VECRRRALIRVGDPAAIGSKADLQQGAAN
jgi:hypothetical protein